MTKVYQQLAQLLSACVRCANGVNPNWQVKHSEKIMSLVLDKFPRGGGFDNGTSFDLIASRPGRLVFSTSYPHTDVNGFYDGWTGHQVIVTLYPVFGFSLRITGKARRGVKDCIHDRFHAALSADETP